MLTTSPNEGNASDSSVVRTPPMLVAHPFAPRARLGEGSCTVWNSLSMGTDSPQLRPEAGVATTTCGPFEREMFVAEEVGVLFLLLLFGR